MAISEHVNNLWKGVEEWNLWRKHNPDFLLDLSAIDLRSADLQWGNFNGVNLRRARAMNANLAWTQLSAANLSLSDLQDANLSESTLTDAVVREADLSRVLLRNASLIRCSFVAANLLGADLTGALLDGTTFCAANLSQVKGLESCKHSGPSFVDYQTLMKSGPLPLAFLRGCGLPESLIKYLPSLLNEAVQLHSCFISYSAEDQQFAEQLHANLQDKGVRCWFAPHDIKGGRKIHEQIDAAIQMYDRLLLILSQASINSEWVKTEIAKARQREIREQRRMLFPLRLTDYEILRSWECFDADTGKDSARELREYFIPDFSNWKEHDSYRQALERLITDLAPEPNDKSR